MRRIGQLPERSTSVNYGLEDTTRPPKSMNDNASLALGGSRSGLGGLPQRLVQDGVVDEAAMLEALGAARERKTSVVTQLVSSGAANARDIAVAASNEFGVPLLDLDGLNLDLEAVRLVNDKLLAKHRVLPVFRRGKRLFLAVADPTNMHAIDEIKFQTSLVIEAVIVEDDKLQKAVDKAIEQVDNQLSALTDEGDVDLESLEVTGGEDELDEKIGRDDVEDAPIVRFVNKVMLDAIRRGASDIHFEPFEKLYRVRLRMDGVLKEIAQPPVQLAKPQGMILVTGPTGSGKTVSLYTGLHILNREDTNISTAEDPAEINLPGVNQVNVNNKVGLTFAAAMRAFLRQDPDVIMVGEIRDLETAEIAIKAAQTGHLVLSTLHTNDAPSTLTRMVDMGVKPYAIATSVNLIIAQRLARRLCTHCKQPLDIPKDALLKEGFTAAEAAGGLKIFAPKGCANCTDGYKGRVGIYQVLPVTDSIARIILAMGSAVEISDQAAKEGVWDLRRAGLEKVKNGLKIGRASCRERV